MGRVIYEIRDLETASNEMLNKIDKAVVAAAFKIRDEMRSDFIRDAASVYKTHTGDINKLAEGIMVGKLRGGAVKIHALGSKDNYDTYKTRFFVGGTIYRTQDKKLGRSIKPYSKGFITALNSVDKGMETAENTLNQFINNTLNN